MVHEVKDFSFFKWIFVNQEISESFESIISIPKKEENINQPIIKEETRNQKEEYFTFAKEDLKKNNTSQHENKKTHINYSLFSIILFASFRFSSMMSMVLIIQVMIQKDVEVFAQGSNTKNFVNSLLQCFYAIVNCISPIFGYFSDHIKPISLFKLNFGKRKPFIAFGMIFFYVTFMIRPFLVETNNSLFFYFYLILTVLGSFFLMIANTAYSGFQVDIFHPSQYNIISSFISFAFLFGEVIGQSLFGGLWNYLPEWVIILLATITSFISALPIFLFPENQSSLEPIEKEENQKKKFCLSVLFYELISVFSPFLDWNFSCCFFAVFISMIGICSIGANFLFFLTDCVKDFSLFGILFFISSNTQANALIGLTKFIFGFIAAFFFPLVSSFITRRIAAFICTLMIVIAYFAYIFSSNFSIIFIFSILAGLGVSGFTAVFYALATANLPNKKNAAKDLSIFSLALSLPSAVALPLMGFLIDWGNELSYQNKVIWSDFGYSILFFGSIACLIIGGLIIGLIKPKK